MSPVAPPGTWIFPEISATTTRQVELDAAIYAIDRLCATSAYFAESILPRITEMITGSIPTNPSFLFYLLFILISNL